MASSSSGTRSVSSKRLAKKDSISALSTAHSYGFGTNGLTDIFVQPAEVMNGSSWSLSSPLAATTAVSNLAGYDAIWSGDLIGSYNRPAHNLFKATRQNAISLFYDSIRTVLGTNDYGTLDYSTINTHPEWYVPNVAGADTSNAANRIAYNYGDPTVNQRWFVDVCNPVFREYAARWFRDRILGIPEAKSGPAAANITQYQYSFDGLAGDNADFGIHFANIVATNYPTWKYAGLQSTWDQGMLAYLASICAALHDVGKLGIFNVPLEFQDFYYDDSALWTSLIQTVDGIVSEIPLESPGHGLFNATNYGTLFAFEFGLSRHEAILNAGKIDWWICHVPNPDTADATFLYVYCSWLLTQRPGKSFFAALDTNNVTLDYPSYYRVTGLPTGNRTKTTNVWWRTFQNKTVYVNPDTVSHVVNSVTVPAGSGKIV